MNRAVDCLAAVTKSVWGPQRKLECHGNSNHELIRLSQRLSIFTSKKLCSVAGSFTILVGIKSLALWTS